MPSWDIASEIESEVTDAYALAELGQRIAPTSGHFLPGPGAGSEVYRRLTAAEENFRAAADEAGRIALTLLDEPDTSRADLQLEALHSVAPTLQRLLHRGER